MENTLCQTFGHQKLKRHYYPDRFTLVCQKCKGRYDTEILDNNQCPKCQQTMQYAKFWNLECLICK